MRRKEGRRKEKKEREMFSHKFQSSFDQSKNSAKTSDLPTLSAEVQTQVCSTNAIPSPFQPAKPYKSVREPLMCTFLPICL
jgi:hypothetical protein